MINVQDSAAQDANPLLAHMADYTDSNTVENCIQDNKTKTSTDGDDEPINPFIPSAGDEEYPMLAV